MNYPQHGGPPHGQHPQQRHVQPHSPPPAREKQRRRWPWVFLGVPIGMLVMLALISIGNGPTPASSGSTSGPAASGGISAATADGSVGDILDNNNSQGPVTVTIKESDGYFETQGSVDRMKVDR
jgi:hypothetical protein